MDIIFRPHFFGAKNTNYDEIYVILSLKTALYYNPNSTIYFISNEPHIIEKYFSTDPPKNLKCYIFEDFEDSNTKIFDNNYIHLSSNHMLFEKFAISSYFYIYNLMNKFNLNDIIIIETDVFVFCNLTDKFNNYFNINDFDIILANKNTICCSYGKKIYFENFVNASLKMYSDIKILEVFKNIYNNMKNDGKNGGICDMTINDWINNDNAYGGLFTKLNSEKKKIKIKELSEILSDKSIFDNYLSHTNYNNLMFDSENSRVGIIKKIYFSNNLPENYINILDKDIINDNDCFFLINNELIKCNSIHFQGSKKLLMPEIYKKIFD